MSCRGEDYSFVMTNISTAPFATRQDIAVAIEELEPLEAKKTAIINNAILGMWFTVGEKLDAAHPPLGSSRVGGDPDLPAGYQWPCNRDGEPLAFLFQLDLSPMGGSFILVFCGNDEPADNVEHHVVFVEDVSTLVRTPVPPQVVRPEFDDIADGEEYDGYFSQSKRLIPHLGWDVPRWSSSWWEAIADDDPEVEEALEELSMNANVENTLIRAGGHIAGIGCDPANDACDANNMPAAQAAGWRHLVTLDSVDGLCIWDAGYFQVLVHSTEGETLTYAAVESS